MSDLVDRVCGRPYVITSEYELELIPPKITEFFSLKKKSGLIHFCDTPGLVDGDMKYPFDVNEAILWMSDLADLVLVFFDPIGQALCKRTLDVVEALSEENSEKLRFFLSKVFYWRVFVKFLLAWLLLGFSLKWINFWKFSLSSESCRFPEFH